MHNLPCSSTNTQKKKQGLAFRNCDGQHVWNTSDIEPERSSSTDSLYRAASRGSDRATSFKDLVLDSITSTADSDNFPEVEVALGLYAVKQNFRGVAPPPSWLWVPWPCGLGRLSKRKFRRILRLWKYIATDFFHSIVVTWLESSFRARILRLLYVVFLKGAGPPGVFDSVGKRGTITYRSSLTSSYMFCDSKVNSSL